MKLNFFAAVAAVLVSIIPILLALTSSTPWGKLKYSFAVVMLGCLIYYMGDRI